MAPTFDRAAARAHLRQLAERYGLTITWVSSWGKAISYPAARQVLLPRLRSGRDYLIGLHEIGHCASADSRALVERFDREGECACEGLAWAWAAANADPEIARGLDRQEWRLVGDAFVSYVREAATSDRADRRYLQPTAG